MTLLVISLGNLRKIALQQLHSDEKLPINLSQGGPVDGGALRIQYCQDIAGAHQLALGNSKLAHDAWL
jgi:hypothetical protein